MATSRERQKKMKDKSDERVKTGTWQPVFTRWMSQELGEAVKLMHCFKTSTMSKGLRAASLGEKIFGKEGADRDGYGTGALQKWADKMVKEGKNPHDVNLLEWFKGASNALDYHMGERTFDDLMEELKSDPDSSMGYVVERVQDMMPELKRMSRTRVIEAIRQKYYTVVYAPAESTL